MSLVRTVTDDDMQRAREWTNAARAERDEALQLVDTAAAAKDAAKMSKEAAENVLDAALRNYNTYVIKKMKPIMLLLLRNWSLSLRMSYSKRFLRTKNIWNVGWRQPLVGQSRMVRSDVPIELWLGCNSS